jgi:translation initiation factor IF-1
MAKKVTFQKKAGKKPASGAAGSLDPRRTIVSDEENELKESKHGYLETQGKVIKVESGRYKVSVKIGEQEIMVDTYASGHLKINKIRIVQSDIVNLLIPKTFDPENGLKGRIIHRKDFKRF